MLGHSRIQMVLRYAHPTEEHHSPEQRGASPQSDNPSLNSKSGDATGTCVAALFLFLGSNRGAAAGNQSATHLWNTVWAIKPMAKRVYPIILMFLIAVTAAAGPRSFASSLRLKLLTRSDRPLKSVPIRVEVTTSNRDRYPSTVQMTTDSSGSALIDLAAGTYSIQVEAIGFDDFSLNNLTIKETEITEVEARLEAAEEVQAMRLPTEALNKLFQACRQADWGGTRASAKRFIIDDEQRWADLWSEFKLVAPSVDFKKWRVVGGFALISEFRSAAKVRRVTYNPKQKVTRVRYELVPQGRNFFYAQVISCVGELVLIPPRPGHVQF